MANTTINRLFNFALTPPNRNLVAAWNLSDLLDSVGTNNLTNNGGATFVSGKIGNAVNLDGVNDFLSIADNAALSMGVGVNFSISFWFKATTIPSAGNVGHILGKGDVGLSFEYAFDITDTGIYRFIVSNDGSALSLISSAANAIVPNVWYFFVIWYDGVALRLEQNNTGDITSLPFTADVFNGTSSFTIGSRAAGTFFNGLVDAVRIYKRVLTAAERSVLFNNGVGREFSSSTIVLVDEINRELNQIINLFNGITKDVTPMIIGNDAINPLIIINQNGAGPIAQFNTTSVKVELLANGQIKSYVPVGTAPILFDVPSNIKVNNLNVDLLDGLEANDFLLDGAYVVQYTSVFFDGTPLVGNRLFFPTVELSGAVLEGFYFQQRNGGASANASTAIAIKKDNDFESLVGTASLNNSNSVATIPIAIVPTTSDTDRMIAEVSSISGAVKHSDITIIARYRHFPFL